MIFETFVYIVNGITYKHYVITTEDYLFAYLIKKETPISFPTFTFLQQPLVIQDSVGDMIELE